jgi:hypothetical protein
MKSYHKIGILRRGNPAPAIISPVGAIKHLMTVYKSLLPLNSFAINL